MPERQLTLRAPRALLALLILPLLATPAEAADWSERLRGELDAAETASQSLAADARKGHGPEDLAIPRGLAPDVLRAARPDISIRRKRQRFGWSDAFAPSILGQMR